MSGEVKSYGLDARFEQWVAELSTSSTSFWGRVGHEIDPDRIADRPSRLVLEACRAISVEGRPPSAPVIVRQRLQAWHQAGRVDLEQLEAACEVLDAAEEDAGMFDEDAVVAELSPVIRRAVELAAIEVGSMAYAKHQDMGQMAKLLERAKRIGETDVSVGSRLSAHSVADILAKTTRTRLGTGITELDAETGGGPKIATLTVFTGGPKSGKSMAMDHMITNAIISCVPSAIATLELEEVDHHARIIGNLCDLPFQDILDYPDVAEEATERMKCLEEDGLLAFCAVKWFPQRATTITDIVRWLDAEEQVYGVKIQCLAIDYYQLLAGEDKKARYQELDDIAKDMFNLAKKRGIWIVTGNQSNAEGMNQRKNKVMGNEHSGESKGITRTCDLHITINSRDDGESILWHIAGHRYGPTGGDVGPLPHEFERGRVAPAIRRGWPY